MESMPEQPKHNLLKTGLVIVAVLIVAGIAIYFSLTKLLLPKISQALGSNSPLGLIAFVGTDGNIYTIDPNQKQKTSITQDAVLNPPGGQVGRVYQYPTWAPNGQSLAFMGFSSTAQGGTQASLYTASSDGKKHFEAFSSQDSFPFYLFWSPNSQNITFLGNAAGSSDLELRMTAASGGESKLIGTGSPYYWDWSPDNLAIVVHTGGAVSDNPDARLALVELSGTIQKKELDLKPGAFQAPAWSPAGDELVLTAETNAGGEELVLAGRDGALKNVLAKLNGPVAFAWSPKGNNLAYSTPVEGDATGLLKHLILLDPAHPDRAKEVAQAGLAAFFWSPDSQKIAYFMLAPENPGQTSRIAGKASMIAAQTNLVLYLQVQVYDLASGNTRHVADFAPTDAFQQVFPFFDQYQRSGTIWSPDSQNLVLAGNDPNGNPFIFVAGADGSKIQKISDGDLAFWSWK